MIKYTFFKSAFALSMLIVAAVTFSGCGEDGPSASEKQMKLLVGTWNITSVTVDGVDYTSIFDGFSLTFTDAPKSYTGVNGRRMWTVSGEFSFVNGAATMFMGPGNQMVTITTLTENALVLEMEWQETTIGSGRTKSIAGHHVFVFNR